MARLAPRGPALVVLDGCEDVADSVAELLAVLLRTGVRGKSAVELARELRAGFGGIAGLLSAGRALERVKALGAAKSDQPAQVHELAPRSPGCRSSAATPSSAPGRLRSGPRVRPAVA